VIYRGKHHAARESGSCNQTGALARPLPLALFMAGIGANDEQPTLAPDQFAVFADTLNARTNFHGRPLGRGNHPL